MKRIEREWAALDGDPNIDDICWFSDTARGDALASGRTYPGGADHVEHPCWRENYVDPRCTSWSWEVFRRPGGRSWRWFPEDDGCRSGWAVEAHRAVAEEARRGFGYEFSDIKDVLTHRSQHRIEGPGR